MYACTRLRWRVVYLEAQVLVQRSATAGVNARVLGERVPAASVVPIEAYRFLSARVDGAAARATAAALGSSRRGVRVRHARRHAPDGGHTRRIRAVTCSPGMNRLHTKQKKRVLWASSRRRPQLQCRCEQCACRSAHFAEKDF